MSKILKESHKRSALRSILWRLIGVGVLALITWIFTRSIMQTTLITILHHGVFLIVYYLHERLWIKIGNRILGRKRSLSRIILYEIVLGQGILALITFSITGALQQMTLITELYIGNKLWIYALYDWIWKKIKWETK